MHGRRAPRIGMSYVDANGGRIVSVDQDVLDIKARIEERWPELEVWLDKDAKPNPVYIVVEKCNDDRQRLVCEVPTLDQRLVDRLERCDTHVRGQEDFVALNERYNDEVEKENERQFAEAIGEANERFLHALRKDGLASRKTFIPNNPLTAA